MRSSRLTELYLAIIIILLYLYLGVYVLPAILGTYKEPENVKDYTESILEEAYRDYTNSTYHGEEAEKVDRIRPSLPSSKKFSNA